MIQQIWSNFNRSYDIDISSHGGTAVTYHGRTDSINKAKGSRRTHKILLISI